VHFTDEITTGTGRDERLAFILQLIGRGRFVPLREITERFGVNMQTARRDIALLDTQGRLTRVHGGAIPREEPDALSVEERLSLRDTEKQQVARTACPLIEDGDVIFLDGGSTTAFLAPLLLERHLHVVTNAIPVAEILKRGWPAIDVIITGGYYYPRSGLLLGPPAIRTLQHIQVNKAFIGAAGVTADGIYNANMLVVELEQAVIAQAAATYLLVDSTKLERTSLTRVCGLEALNTLVTTGSVSPELSQALELAQCRVLTAPMP